MARLFTSVLITILTILALLFVGGCGENSDINESSRPAGPANVAMAEHMRIYHDFSIVNRQSEEKGDMTVHQTENGTIHVEFCPSFLENTNQHFLRIIGFEKGKKELTPREYLTMLDRLHAYLSIYPK